MLTIELKFNNAVLKTIETEKEVITIGRNVKNDIQIDNLSVSKQHAKIVKNQGKYFLEDLNSTNGTYLNEKKVSKEKLTNNDTITIGKHTLVAILEKQKLENSDPEMINDTMMLTTEKHKQMLEKQKKVKSKK
ncbi:MAG: FHA domain-containing protein [Deltaproteobacteria bacterium]|nr:MAG: FHA domain-containing protein [Deltaproteobacteria bacterium]